MPPSDESDAKEASEASAFEASGPPASLAAASDDASFDVIEASPWGVELSFGGVELSLPGVELSLPGVELSLPGVELSPVVASSPASRPPSSFEPALPAPELDEQPAA
jgi:hypothetical protein